MKSLYMNQNRITARFITIGLLMLALCPALALCQNRRDEKSRLGLGIGYDFLTEVNLAGDEELVRVLQIDYRVNGKMQRAFSGIGRLRLVLHNRVALGVQIESLTHETETERLEENILIIYPFLYPPLISIHERVSPAYFDVGLRLGSSGSLHFWLGGSITKFHVEREMVSDMGSLKITEKSSANLPSYRVFGEIELGATRSFSLWLRSGYRFAKVNEFDDTDRPASNYALDFSGAFINAGIQFDVVR